MKKMIHLLAYGSVYTAVVSTVTLLVFLIVALQQGWL